MRRLKQSGGDGEPFLWRGRECAEFERECVAKSLYLPTKYDVLNPQSLCKNAFGKCGTSCVPADYHTRGLVYSKGENEREKQKGEWNGRACNLQGYRVEKRQSAPIVPLHSLLGEGRYIQRSHPGQAKGSAFVFEEWSRSVYSGSPGTLAWRKWGEKHGRGNRPTVRKPQPIHNAGMAGVLVSVRSVCVLIRFVFRGKRGSSDHVKKGRRLENEIENRSEDKPVLKWFRSS